MLLSRHTRRREFIALAGATAAWPFVAGAQQPTMLVIGYLSARSPDDTAHLVAAFRRGLSEHGFIEGQNATIEYRWALGQYGRVLKGDKPAELPVIQAVKFQLVINLKTAKALGVKISDNLLSLADEVIE
jgi:hypothetical protein